MGSAITSVRVLGGWLYLTVALDLFDRKVIGWAFSVDLETVYTVIPTLRMAFANRMAQEGLVFHSDRGCSMAHQGFAALLAACCPTLRQSMSRKGNGGDKACAEFFFKTLKRDLETLDGNHSAVEVRQSVFRYLEAYYHRVRLHSALDYVAPGMFTSGWVA